MLTSYILYQSKKRSIFALSVLRAEYVLPGGHFGILFPRCGRKAWGEHLTLLPGVCMGKMNLEMITRDDLEYQKGNVDSLGKFLKFKWHPCLIFSKGVTF